MFHSSLLKRLAVEQSISIEHRHIINQATQMKSRMEVFYQRYGDVIKISNNKINIVNSSREEDSNEPEERSEIRPPTLSSLSFTDLSGNFDLIMKQKHHNF
jgi:hypothetical protein